MNVNEFQEIFGDKKVVVFHVNESVYRSFQECSGDINPLHTVKSFAQGKGFSDIVMYGNILNAFISFFVGECLPTKDVVIHSQEIEYKNPVYLNDELIMESTISGVYESVEAIEFKFKFLKSNSKLVAKGTIQIGLLQ
jgi:acyl dehydratase